MLLPLSMKPHKCSRIRGLIFFFLSICQALERFKGIAVRRKPLNSSLALSPVNSGRRFQFPAPVVAAKSVIGPHLVSPLKEKEKEMEHTPRALISPQEHEQGQTEQLDAIPVSTPETETAGQDPSAASNCDSQGSTRNNNNGDPTPPALPADQLPGPVASVVSASTTQESYSLLKEIFGANR
jgi:hypothetical protein